jgi:glutathione S-transferase
MSLTPAHGYVLGVALSSSLFMTYLGIKVAGQRKLAGVPYPYLYADRAEAEKDSKKKLFNCYQRAHQNTLENYPTFLLLLATSAIEHPLLAAVSGVIWILGKYFYAQG